MKKIYIRKTFLYDPTFGGKFSRYAGYCKISLQKESPGISNKLRNTFKGLSSPVFSSPLRRAVETAKTINIDSKIVILPELKEIVFDLSKLVSEKDFDEKGSTLVREHFIRSFLNDSLSESRESIEKRIDNLIERLKKLPSGKYLLISHSFFMKLFQIYLTRRDFFQKPEIVFQYFDPKIKTFCFGRGFDFELE